MKKTFLALIILIILVLFSACTLPTIGKESATMIVFEEKNVAVNSIQEFLRLGDKLAKEKWSIDASLKLIDFNLVNTFPYYSMTFTSVSKKTSEGKPGPMTIYYNFDIQLRDTDTQGLKAHGGPPKSNYQLTGVFCYQGSTCIAISEKKEINIRDIKVAPEEVYKKISNDYPSGFGRIVIAEEVPIIAFGKYRFNASTGAKWQSSEENTNKIENDISKNNQEPVVNSNDFDSDGLNNSEEEKIGTDIFKPDSDGDGYKDGEEVKNGYNPFGPGKMLEFDDFDDNDKNLEWTIYLNNSFNFFINYPVNYEFKKSAPNDVAFRKVGGGEVRIRAMSVEEKTYNTYQDLFQKYVEEYHYSVSNNISIANQGIIATMLYRDKDKAVYGSRDRVVYFEYNGGFFIIDRTGEGISDYVFNKIAQSFTLK